MASIKSTKNYAMALAKFCQRLQADQITGLQVVYEKHPIPELIVYYETGRKFDKIFIDVDGKSSVRYFVNRSNGAIYGAKSKFAPNLQWYFGTIYNSHKWQWNGHHGVPIDDPTVRLVKKYGVYHHYMLIEGK